MVDGGASEIDHIAPVATVGIGDFASAPMFGGNKGNGGTGKAETFPPLHFVDLFKTETVDEVAHARGDDDRLVGGDLSQASPIEVVEMSVGDEDEVDRGELVVFHSCVAEAPDDKKPIRPVRIDQNIAVRSLDKKRGVPDPRDGNLART